MIENRQFRFAKSEANLPHGIPEITEAAISVPCGRQ